jgi:hypothetical protein
MRAATRSRDASRVTPTSRAPLPVAASAWWSTRCSACSSSDSNPIDLSLSPLLRHCRPGKLTVWLLHKPAPLVLLLVLVQSIWPVAFPCPITAPSTRSAHRFLADTRHHALQNFLLGHLVNSALGCARSMSSFTAMGLRRLSVIASVSLPIELLL